jgi:hypothetical protein
MSSQHAHRCLQSPAPPALLHRSSRRFQASQPRRSRFTRLSRLELCSSQPHFSARRLLQPRPRSDPAPVNLMTTALTTAPSRWSIDLTSLAASLPSLEPQPPPSRVRRPVASSSAEGDGRQLPYLPIELVASILARADRSTLVAASQVCWDWLRESSPILYESVTIDRHGSFEELFLQRVRSLLALPGLCGRGAELTPPPPCCSTSFSSGLAHLASARTLPLAPSDPTSHAPRPAVDAAVVLAPGLVDLSATTPAAAQVALGLARLRRRHRLRTLLCAPSARSRHLPSTLQPEQQGRL